jgi:predicted nucleotidyltransferase
MGNSFCHFFSLGGSLQPGEGSNRGREHQEYPERDFMRRLCAKLPTVRRFANHQKEIFELAERYQVSRLSLFGSVLRGDSNPESDIDLLVEFKPGSTIGYFTMAKMQDELSELLDGPVDLRTPAELSVYFREQAMQSAQALYVA